MDAVLDADCGGLLASPVRDTMKRVEGGRVTSTVPRDGLWHALTPQMFPLGALRDALLAARADGTNSTDEAQAMERQGYQPLVVEGRADNIKITRPEDLDLAAMFLRNLSQRSGTE
jgi:2-C-methyl-D-erythritol 4-phosphate cytidylyltransferase